MEKLVTSLLAFLMMVSVSFGQTAKPMPVSKAKVLKTAPAAPTAASATKMKKDGTPDKRFKENKPTQHLKKDGTPDMRYKENKAKK